MANLSLKIAAAGAVLVLSMHGAWAAQCGENTSGNVNGVDKAAGVIKLGTIQPVTGRVAAIGVGVSQGIAIAVNEINAKGGIDGCKLQVVTLDNQYQLDATVVAGRRLVDQDKVWAVVAPTGSAYLPAIYATLNEAGTPLWAPISPSDQNIPVVYLVATPRADQVKICIDYFADKGIKKVGAISQTNDVGIQVEDGLKTQSKIRKLDVVALEKIDIQSPNVSTPVLNVIKSGAQGVIVGLDPATLPTTLNSLHESGFSGPICSDGGSAGVGSMGGVGASTPDAHNGFLSAMQTALPNSDAPAALTWKKAADAYTGEFKNNADPAFSLQGYAYTMAFGELIGRLKGNLSHDNFRKVAEDTRNNPIKNGIMPDVVCGPIPGGHTCAKSAGLAKLDAKTKTWTQIQPFQTPKE